MPARLTSPGSEGCEFGTDLTPCAVRPAEIGLLAFFRLMYADLRRPPAQPPTKKGLDALAWSV